MLCIQRVPVAGQHYLFETGDDQQTRILGEDATFPLRVALQTQLSYCDRPGFLDALVERSQLDREGVVGFVYAQSSDGEVPAGKVLVYFQRDDQFIDEAVFTELAMANVRAHVEATGNDALAAVYADTMIRLEQAGHRVPVGLRRRFMPTMQVDIHDQHRAASGFPGETRIATLYSDGASGLLRMVAPAYRQRLMTLFFEPWSVLSGGPVVAEGRRDDGEVNTLAPLRYETLRYLVEYGLAAHGLRGELMKISYR